MGPAPRRPGGRGRRLPPAPFAVPELAIRAELGLQAAGAGRKWMDGVIVDLTELRRAEEALRRQEVEPARVQELRASRARIVAAADAARRRMGRDLHDTSPPASGPPPTSLCEALTNVAKYAAMRAPPCGWPSRTAPGRRGPRRRRGRCGRRVRDGLTGLADRVGAQGGALSVASPAGTGTEVRAVIPLDGTG